MGPEQARLIRLGAGIAAAHLRGDTTARDQLLESLGDTVAESALLAPKAFAFLSHAAAGVLARLRNESLEQALRRVPAQDAELLPEVPTNWQAAANLVIAVHHNDPEIDRISSVMSVPTAVTSTFSVAIALIQEIAEGTGWLPADTAMTFAETIRNFFRYSTSNSSLTKSAKSAPVSGSTWVQKDLVLLLNGLLGSWKRRGILLFCRPGTLLQAHILLRQCILPPRSRSAPSQCCPGPT